MLETTFVLEHAFNNCWLIRLLAEQYGGKAHERAKKFDWPTIIGREVALYERLVEEGRIAR